MYERVYFVLFYEQNWGKMTHVEGIGDSGGGAINIVMQKHKDFRNCPPYFSQGAASNRVQSGIGTRKMPKRIVEEISVDDEIYPTRPVSPMAWLPPILGDII